MSHNVHKARQEVSLVGRILSMEVLLFLMGVLSLVYGIVKGEGVNIFFGLIIIPGVFILMKVRKKDWKKHWEDLEAERRPRSRRNDQDPPGDGPGKE